MRLSRSLPSVLTGSTQTTAVGPATSWIDAIARHPDWRVGKAQWLRLADIWLLGPAMMYSGWTGKFPDWWKLASFIGGWYTIKWNWVNYKRVQEAEELWAS